MIAAGGSEDDLDEAEDITNPLYEGIQLATASSSLEPSYSYACLDGLEILPGLTMGDMMR